MIPVCVSVRGSALGSINDMPPKNPVEPPDISALGAFVGWKYSAMLLR